MVNMPTTFFGAVAFYTALPAANLLINKATSSFDKNASIGIENSVYPGDVLSYSVQFSINYKDKVNNERRKQIIL